MLYMRMRSEMSGDYGEVWKKKVLFHFLAHEEQLKFASKFARLGRNLVLEYLAF